MANSPSELVYYESCEFPVLQMIFSASDLVLQQMTVSSDRVSSSSGDDNWIEEGDCVS